MRLRISKALPTFWKSAVPGLGQAFYDAVLEELSAIAKRPKSFPVCFGANVPTSAGYRQALVSPFHYLILFRPTDEGVIVYAVMDARRNPTAIGGRLPPTDSHGD